MTWFCIKNALFSNVLLILNGNQEKVRKYKCIIEQFSVAMGNLKIKNLKILSSGVLIYWMSIFYDPEES